MRAFSRLVEAESGREDHSWLINIKGKLTPARKVLPAVEVDLTVDASFEVTGLAELGVSAMDFPWRVFERPESDNEMLAKVHADAEASCSRYWNGTSGASILDASTSISSTIFHRDLLLWIPTAIGSSKSYLRHLSRRFATYIPRKHTAKITQQTCSY